MNISQKCQYALRALLELAIRWDQGPAKINEIAAAQSIPIRFLEVILNQLKQGGFADSRRGKAGGYFLARPPVEITVGEVIRFVEGPLGPVECVNGNPWEKCPLYDRCIFLPLWMRAQKALSDIYDSTTFQQLVEDHRARKGEFRGEYAI